MLLCLLSMSIARIMLASTFVFSIGLASTPVQAQSRVRVTKAVKSPKQKAVTRSKASPRKASSSHVTTGLRNAMPKRIGEGFFSRVYQSRDGKWVIKKMRPAIAGVEPVSKSQRSTMARTTVRVSELLRKSGLPVPQMYIPKGKEAVIVQKFSSGLTFGQLQGKAKFEASKNLMVFFGKATRTAKTIKGYDKNWYVDKNRDNVLFEKSGKVLSWIDPVVPTSGAKVQRAIDKLQAAAAN